MDRIQPIVDYPVPKTLRQLKTFIGVTSYCRNFVPYFADLAAPLHKLDKKGAIWKWEPEHQNAFDKIKAALQDARVMLIFDPLKPITIQTDASKTGVGAVLLQPDENGHLRPVEYASRRTTLAEQNYNSQESECLAVTWALKRWHAYLQGQKFHIETDNAAIVWLRTKIELTRLALGTLGTHAARI